MALPLKSGFPNIAQLSNAYLKYWNPGREPGGKINRGFVRTLLLHLNSARSGDTQWRQSYSSPAKRGKGEGGGGGSVAVHTVCFD